MKELEEGRIPLDSKQMTPVEVWNKYCDEHDAFEGMEYDRTFTTRLYALRNQVKKASDRRVLDQQAYDIHRKNFPRKTHDSRGRPNWFGSIAEELLRADLDEGLYPFMKPEDIYHSRAEYMEYSLEVFRGHIHQSIKTGKFRHTLKTKDQEKKAQSAAKREKMKQKAAKKAAKKEERGVIWEKALV